MGYTRVITHLLTIDPNFQQDILVWNITRGPPQTFWSGETFEQKNDANGTDSSLKSWQPWTGWWFHIFSILFSPRRLGKMMPFWRRYFSKGLVQPPTSLQNEWRWKKKTCVGFPGNHETWAQTTIAWCHFGLTQGRRENTARLSWLCGDWTRQTIGLLRVFIHSNPTVLSGSVVDTWMFQVPSV